ncbi:hypothetical protein GCM10009604_12620 [Corynebacterium aurimucosum]
MEAAGSNHFLPRLQRGLELLHLRLALALRSHRHEARQDDEDGENKEKKKLSSVHKRPVCQTALPPGQLKKGPANRSLGRLQS